MANRGAEAADRRAQFGRKLRDGAALLPLIGAGLLTTPLVSAVGDGPAAALVYIFAVWAALIVAAAALSRLLRAESGGE